MTTRVQLSPSPDFLPIMNIIRQAVRGINSLLRREGGAIYRNGELIFRPLPSESIILQALAASGGINRWRRIPTIITTSSMHTVSTLRGTHERCLSRPTRLTLRQTKQAEIRDTAAKSSTLKIGHLNVRSLTAHLDEINHLLLAEQLDILCLGETWLTDAVDTCMLNFPGYVISRKDRPIKKSGGGVAIIHRNNMNVERLRVPVAKSTLESMWLQVISKSPIIVGVVYRPPSGQPTPAIEDMHSQLTHVRARDQPIYLLGDTNFDVTRPDKPGVTSYLQQLSDLSLKQLITEPTHPGLNPSLIDHMITNRPELTADARVVPYNISDHDLITASVSVVKTRHVVKQITVRATRHVNTNALCLELLQADWATTYGVNGTSDKWNNFFNTWDPIINKHMPMRKITLKHRPYPWLEDEDVREAMAARDQARIDRECTPCDVTEKEFRERRNAVKVVLNRACASYFQTSFKHSKSKTWRDIRQFLVSSKKAEPRVESASHRSADWADQLNSFFISVGSGVAHSLAAADAGEPLPPRPPRVSSGAFVPQPATLPELSAALRRMGSSRACGSDGITIEMLRLTFAVVGPHLLHIINSCIVKCDMPLQWKAAIVTPLFKKGDRNDPSNYRPISIIPVVAKLCERVICTQLMTYLTSHCILCPQQYGFRPGLSTEAAVLDAVVFATDNIDRGLVTSLVTADTSKAFDSVEHGRLLDKLGWYGIRSEWFADWLQGRTQTLKGRSSHALGVTHGVVQGSILGPVLFLIFTNDLTQHLPHGKVIMYADDAQFLDTETPSNIQALKTRVEINLDIALKWFTQNRLKINPSKTEMIILKSSRQKSDIDFSVLFGSNEISPSSSVKVLGVTIDPHLKWEKHVSSVVQRCYMVLVGLARVRHRVPKDTKRMLVEALVFPHIRYCISVWGSCTVQNKKRVQKAINFGARIVTGLGQTEHVTPVLQQLEWGKIDDILDKHDLSIVHHLMTD